MEERFLNAFGKMTYGIYVLTTLHGKTVNGMVASWVSQVSYAPPLIMVAVHPNRYSHNLIEKSGYFALHVLAQNQADVLKRFKGPDPAAKFASVSWSRGKMGCPILSSCIAYMECRVKAVYNPGNHTLFVGEVKDAEQHSEEVPLTTLDYPGVYTGKN
jgi:flavin reductase (DIM6/NTAB) family NADH-FMN oxidoreductase RutF